MYFAAYETARFISSVPAVSYTAENHIREAVKECLARCYAGGTPLGVIAEYIASLREKGWSDDDIRAVELAVRKVLAGIVGTDSSSPSAVESD
jgi:hypothetical protein